MVPQTVTGLRGVRELLKPSEGVMAYSVSILDDDGGLIDRTVVDNVEQVRNATLELIAGLALDPDEIEGFTFTVRCRPITIA